MLLVHTHKNISTTVNFTRAHTLLYKQQHSVEFYTHSHINSKTVGTYTHIGLVEIR